MRKERKKAGYEALFQRITGIDIYTQNKETCQQGNGNKKNAATYRGSTWDSFVPYQNDKAPKKSCQRINGGNRMKTAKRLADRARAKAPIRITGSTTRRR